jgi:hypothetical protein
VKGAPGTQSRRAPDAALERAFGGYDAAGFLAAIPTALALAGWSKIKDQLK